ncbi:hypothetical protein [Paenibacillus sp. OAS669]|uniref:hypothetical protein n=1 Tax=Paenibacillus sp. OAS669 TaxID=2663821 RepID=UPI001788FD58|nr:hypothetical protein [Paenibacillus sp. OAS669]MBE1444770.1 hypothetical protein [Paenibacillus sp. OAS669]
MHTAAGLSNPRIPACAVQDQRLTPRHDETGCIRTWLHLVKAEAYDPHSTSLKRDSVLRAGGPPFSSVINQRQTEGLLKEET